MLGDSLWALGLLMFSFASVSTFGLTTGWSLVVSLAFAVPLLWRRVDADLAGLIIVVAHVVQLFASGTPLPVNVVVPIIMYAVAAYGRPRFSQAWLYVGLLSSAIAAARWAPLNFASPRLADSLVIAFPIFVACGGVVASTWYMGTLARTRAARRQAEADRLAALERERQQAVLLTASEERQRIAREMHDIVAHSLSVIVVQADGGHYAATMDADPEQRLATAAKALETIRSTARSALGETRRLVGVLASDEPLEYAPAASLAEIPELVQRVADAGRQARLDVEGTADLHAPLDAAQELTVYRIVQEALTNVMKHAGAGAAVTVTLSHRPDGVSVAIRDDGAGSRGGDGAGHGLVGMRQRIEAVAGTLYTGNRPGGGFEVVAFVPTTPLPTATTFMPGFGR